jgi:hypothetical protein
MPDDLQLIEADKRYSMFSGLTLLAIPISCSVSYLIFGNHTWLNAVALLLVPFAALCWIFTTIKGIHGRRAILVHSLDLRHSDRRRHIVRHERYNAACLSGVCKKGTGGGRLYPVRCSSYSLWRLRRLVMLVQLATNRLDGSGNQSDYPSDDVSGICDRRVQSVARSKKYEAIRARTWSWLNGRVGSGNLKIGSG